MLDFYLQYFTLPGPSPSSLTVNLKKKETRQALRLGDDHSMSVYVKGATQLEVTNTAEAYRAMAYGNRNKKVSIYRGSVIGSQRSCD